MKKFFLSVLVLSALPLLFSCGKQSETNTTVTTPPTTPPSPPAVTTVDLTINQNALQDYTIVYAPSPFDVRKAAQFNTEYDFYKLIAKELAERIRIQTGVTLPVTKDTAAESELEILVGPTNRSESSPINDQLDVYQTYVKVVGSKLVVGGGYDSSVYTADQRNSHCFASTYHAWDRVESYLAKSMEEGKSSVDLPSDADFSTQVDLITVACIGDSITEGDGSDVWSIHSYPAVLERFLWKDHLVINLGKCGKTMLEDHERHYRNGCMQYTAMCKYASRFDYVLLMMGTNDFIQHTNWPAANDEKFFVSAEHLVEDITQKNDSVELVIMNSAVYYGNSGASADHVRDLQAQLPARLAEKGLKTYFFDMYDYTVKNVGKTNFKDSTHPNNNGYAIIAKGVAEMLVAVENGSYGE